MNRSHRAAVLTVTGLLPLTLLVGAGRAGAQAGAASAAAPTAARSAASCSHPGYSRAARSVPHSADGELFGVRAGRHACYERLVFDVIGPAPGYSIGYAPGGSDLVLRIAGVTPSEQDSEGREPSVTGFRALRKVTFEGIDGKGPSDSLFRISVRGRQPFHVSFLDGGPGLATSRLVIDVAVSG